MAEKGEESLMPSFRAILYRVEFGIPNSLEALHGRRGMGRGKETE